MEFVDYIQFISSKHTQFNAISFIVQITHAHKKYFKVIAYFHASVIIIFVFHPEFRYTKTLK